MFEIGVVSQFEAAHSLRGDFGPAKRTHGHTYRVEAAVRGPALQSDGTLYNIATLKHLVQAVIGGLDYRDLDELDAFKRHNSTAEGVVRYLFEEIAPPLRGQGLKMLVVRVWESPQAYASYEGSLD